jgi:SpoIIAA-like
MFQKLAAPKDTVLAFRISGSMSDRETERIVHQIQAHAARYGKTRLFLVMDHYASFNSAEDLYEDLRFARRCGDLIQRLAVLGDRPWKSTWVALFGLFGAMDTAYFDRSETQAALQWLAA